MITAARLARRESVGARHRAVGRTRTASYDATFAAAHCGGETCFHDHADRTREQQAVDAGQPGKAAYLRARRQLTNH